MSLAGYFLCRNDVVLLCGLSVLTFPVTVGVMLWEFMSMAFPCAFTVCSVFPAVNIWQACPSGTVML